jgi:hypothetical protein
MPSQHEVPHLTAAVIGIHKARSLELDTGQEQTLSHILKLLCELASGVQFSKALLDMVEKGDKEKFAPESLALIILGAVRTLEILGSQLDSEMILHLSTICHKSLLLNEELKLPNQTYVSYYAEKMVNEIFPREVIVV